jgi:hypothetical protein
MLGERGGPYSDAKCKHTIASVTTSEHHMDDCLGFARPDQTRMWVRAIEFGPRATAPDLRRRTTGFATSGIM